MCAAGGRIREAFNVERAICAAFASLQNPACNIVAYTSVSLHHLAPCMLVHGTARATCTAARGLMPFEIENKSFVGVLFECRGCSSLWVHDDMCPLAPTYNSALVVLLC
jgi:hypothetical protein